MNMAFRGALDAVTRVRGVRGAMVVSREDGLVVADTLMEGVKGNALAALAASLFQRVGYSTIATGAGEPRFVQLQSEEGILLALAPSAELLIVAVTESAANVGLVRLEMLRAGDAVQ